ncbi:MAG TPA: amidohydrolase [Fimbriimonadaceae bacterium]|jgi:amidohydrolase
MSSVASLISSQIQDIVEIRRDLHAHPELGYNEVRTSGVVTRELEKAGIKHEGGLAGGTGVLGYLPATSNPEDAPTIALRADMDALPIIENTGKPYASQHEGVMHACGHDGHTSILIGAARVLAKSERPNNVLLVFQPAEEGGAGGRKMCEAGVLNGTVLGKPVERIFGLHGFPMLEVGQVATRKGALLASADQFTMTIRGKGGHAAMPHFGIDPIVAASQIVLAFQTIVSRNVNPLDSAVVTIGEFHAGTASNIIPDEAHLVGTLRTLNRTTRELGMHRIEKIAKDISEAFGAHMSIEWRDGYPVTWNDPVATDDFRQAIAPAFGNKLVAHEVDPVMGGEDFSFYGEHVPACFYWLGLVPEGGSRYANLHAPEFDFNDDALAVGINAMCTLALASYANLGSKAGRELRTEKVEVGR